LHEVYESKKYIHLVLSYLDGGELFERIKSKQVYQEKTAISVMKNMLEALNYMHENKVVHRDLKPENLILASKKNDHDLRIADFGLASFVKDGELLKLRCGSPGYVAPEILQDVGYNEMSDIFSAGVILYVLLTGRPAFRGYNLNEILVKNKNAEVEYPAKYWNKISVKAKDLVSKMLEKDPEKRITS
jgi:serine/threonine protein kinase